MPRRFQNRPNTNALNPQVKKAAQAMSKRLTARGIKHALIGGLAVNHYGYKRTTADVDFIVHSDNTIDLAGDPLGGVVRGRTMQSSEGVTVDFVFPREGEEFLDRAVGRATGALPVLPLEALIYMKLSAGRMRDQADVMELLKKGRVDERRVLHYLREHAPFLAEEFESMIEQAKLEAD